MAFPQAPTVGRFNGSGTSHNVTLPASIASGDLLVIIFGFDGTSPPAQVSLATGWTKVVEEGAGGSTDGGLVWGYRIADGTEGATTTVTTNNESVAAHVYRITTWHGTTPPEGATTTAATTINPDPPSLTPSWGAEDTLWLVGLYNNNAAHTVTAYPANYTDGISDANGTNFNGARCSSARRELNAATEDPGTFTLTNSNPVAVATIAIRPAAGGASLTVGDSTHAHTSESPTLTQASTLAAADSTHSHTSEEPTLSQSYTLSVDDTRHGHTSESPTLNQAVTLDVEDTQHTHTSESPVLTQAIALAIDDTQHSHTSESPVLTQASTLSVDDTRHSHTSESPVLTPAGALSVDDTAHGHTSESPTLTQAATLTVDDTTHEHTSESPTLTSGAQLARSGEGLLFFDDFNRADGAAGANWSGGNILSNRLRVTGGGTNVRCLGATPRVKGVMQCGVKTPGAGGPTFRHRTDDWAYYVQIQGGGEGFLFLRNPSYTNLSSSWPVGLPDTLRPFKAIWDESLQRVYVDNGAQTVSAVNTVLNGTLGVGGVHNNNAAYVELEDYSEYVSNLVTVTDLPAGYKVRIGTRVATEVGGTAIVDLVSDSCPIPLLEILNASDVVVDSLAPPASAAGGPAGVWGGDEYSFTGVVAGDSLVVDDTTHGHTSESPTLSTGLILEVDDTRHGHTSESPAPTQASTLDVDDTQHSHTSESPALTLGGLDIWEDCEPESPAPWEMVCEPDSLAPWDSTCDPDYLTYILSIGPNRHHIANELEPSHHPWATSGSPPIIYWGADATGFDLWIADPINYEPRLAQFGFDSYTGVEPGQPSLISDGRTSFRFSQQPFFYAQFGVGSTEGIWIRPDRSWAIAAWILPESPLLAVSRFFSWANDQVAVHILADGTIRLRYVNTFTSVVTLVDSQPGVILSDEISFIVARYDHGTGTMEIFVNNEIVLSTQETPPDTSHPSWDDQPFGMFNSGAPSPHWITVQHITLWKDRVPSNSEIATAFAIGTAGSAVSSASPWTFQS